MSNYVLAWGVYIAAAVIYYGIFWRITRWENHRLMSYSLRALTLAVIVTPWYISDAEELWAPAIIIVMMDLITIGPDAAIRALVPLLLTIVICFVAALAVLLIRKDSKQHAKKKPS